MVNFKHLGSSDDITIKSLLPCFVRLGSLPWEDSIGGEQSNQQSYGVTPGHVFMELHTHLFKTLKSKDLWPYIPGPLCMFFH